MEVDFLSLAHMSITAVIQHTIHHSIHPPPSPSPGMLLGSARLVVLSSARTGTPPLLSSSVAASIVCGGISSLFTAAENGEAGVIRQLVMDGADPNQANSYGDTALHISATHGHETVVRCLVLQCRAHVNQPNYEGTTPLHGAVENGHGRVVRCLVVECGADVNRSDYESQTPLHIAIQWRGDALSSYLYRMQGDQHPADDHVAMVRCLVQGHGADVNLPDMYGHTALHDAASTGHEVVARLLIHEGGGDPTQIAESGYTPLHTAAACGHVVMVRFFVHECGADPNQTDFDDQTPLWIAAQNGWDDVVKFLARLPDTVINTRACAGGKLVTPVEVLRARGNNGLSRWLDRVCFNTGCGHRGKKKCARCGVASYCGRECQVMHWKAGHSGECPGQ
jgi:ankyrin repeat protein